jgi:hypothetical protein
MATLPRQLQRDNDVDMCSNSHTPISPEGHLRSGEFRGQVFCVAAETKSVEMTMGKARLSSPPAVAPDSQQAIFEPLLSPTSTSFSSHLQLHNLESLGLCGRILIACWQTLRRPRRTYHLSDFDSIWTSICGLAGSLNKTFGPFPFKMHPCWSPSTSRSEAHREMFHQPRYLPFNHLNPYT